MRDVMKIAMVCVLLLEVALFASTAERIYLSGKGPSDAVEWDFYCSKGRRSGEWTTIPVPSNWEQHGFGNYNYGHDDPDTKHDETGTYRTSFMVRQAWKDKHVRLVFEGSMTETSIKINGQSVGAPNMGGYIPFRYILNKTNVKYGQKNTLEVLVKKKPDNRSLDHAERKADYWVFGGIYRPVYLDVQPKDFVNRVAIDARADGSLRLDVFPQIQRDTKFRTEMKLNADEVVAQVQTREGVDVGSPMSAPIRGGSGRIRLQTKIKRPALWSPEYPNLYQIKVSIRNKDELVSEMMETFGFRTIEMRPEDGFYLNGQKILIQGMNRNVFDPDHGRAIDLEEVWTEARMIKAMNVNLVRSHMPPTFEFMRACDELGMMVITELTNWHDPYIDTPLARNIAYELVTHYQNHPSVILWANGNENGFNLEIDELYHLYDLQNRPVIHPWSYFEGIDTVHYPTYETLQRKLKGPAVYLPTEFLHGLYDGGHGAAMEDYWQAIRKSPTGAGGVLWCWGDAAIKRTDMDGKLDTFGNRSADGIVGPYGEKEASYFTVREIWSPVQIPLDTLPGNFKGKLPIQNRYIETSLNECTFQWRLLEYVETKTSVRKVGKLNGPKVAPGKTGSMSLPLPTDWRSADVLELTAFNPHGLEIMKWSWSTGRTGLEPGTKQLNVKQVRGKPFDVISGDTRWSFSPKDGQLLSCVVDGKDLGLGKGPVLYAGTLEKALEFPDDWKASASTQKDSVVIESKNHVNDSSFVWTLSSDGQVTLDYSFAAIEEKIAYCAMGFDLVEKNVTSKRWLGDGPYRIWANRLKGPQFGLWENTYNDISTGQQWGEPEFKGIFSNVDWMQINLKSGHSLLIEKNTDVAVGVLRPRYAEGVLNKNTHAGPVRAWWHYPEAGGLHLFHKLPAVGTKFKNAWDLGPQGEPAKVPGLIQGRVSFRVQ